MKKTHIAYALSALLFSSSAAHAANIFDSRDIYNGAGVKLFSVGEVNGTNSFRIPAIASAGNGVLIAAADVRYRDDGQIWHDIFAQSRVWKVHLSTKVSFDGGQTWSDINILNAEDAKNGTADNTYKSLATDAAMVYDPVHDTALMFGLRNNVNLKTGAPQDPGITTDIQGVQQTQDSDFIMFTSKDKGLTWESKSIYDDILAKVNVGNTGSQYSVVFQGPGGGMAYNGKIYVPLQAWMPDAASKYTSTSGFMVSEDGGENWEVSPMLIPNIAANTGASARPNTSESNIFHYKGKIRLAVRNETNGPAPNANPDTKLRLCYEYDEKAKTWTQVEESFIPQNVAQVETSTHNLSEDVYLVGYTSYYYYDFQGNKNRRKGQTLATNTGIKLLLADKPSEGYTSITSDDSNIYVMYEGELEKMDIFFKAIDWKHRDYANLNTQIRNRANAVNRIADRFAASSGYMSGSFGSDGAGGEIIGSAGALKGGIFVSKNDDMDKDNSAVVEYDTFDVALVTGLDQQFSKNIKGTVMLGYMNSDIDYANGAENDVSSFIGSYRLQFDTDVVGIRSGIAAVYSQNDFKRNTKEGLGKTADFSSYSISLSNEVFKDFEMREFGNVELTGGMVNTFFSHDDFREKGGEGEGENGQQGANNATIRALGLQSHEVFVKAAWNSKPIELCDYANISFNSDMKYAIDLADADDWNEEYRSMSVERKFDSIGELYSARDGGLFTATVGADLAILKQITIGVKGIADSRGEFSANLEGKISL